LTCGSSHRPCTIDPNAPCEQCDIKGKLHCDPGNKQRGRLFYRALTGLVLSSLCCLTVATFFEPKLWWTVPLYVVYWLVYWLVVELLIHCPHCPYWNDQSPEINCLSTCGIKKPTWPWLQPLLRHNRRPYAAWEKATLHVFNLFSLIFPVVILSHVAWSSFHWTMAASATLFAAASTHFIYVLRTKMCAGCANVACSINALPKDVAKAYLAKNPLDFKRTHDRG
jgi:hypothetical protein